MGFTDETRIVLLKLVPSISTLMACSFTSDEIHCMDIEDVEDAGERIIKDELLKVSKSAIGKNRAWFRGDKFEDWVTNGTHDRKVAQVFNYLCDVDLGLTRLANETDETEDDVGIKTAASEIDVLCG